MECFHPSCTRQRRKPSELYCDMHRQRLKSGKNMDDPPQIRYKTLQERMEAHTQVGPNCWLWTGTINRTLGYGTVVVGSKVLNYAHRVAYERNVGPIPEGYWIDHLCRNRACVRPDHLRAVPPGVNTRDGLRGWGLTKKCRRGLHDVTDPANVERSGSGRRCKPCRQEAQRRKRSE